MPMAISISCPAGIGPEANRSSSAWPVSNSIARYGRPCQLPVSSTVQMLGGLSAEAAPPSRSKRHNISGSSASFSARILRATKRPRTVSCALKTIPMAPRPISSRMRYFETVWPIMGCFHDKRGWTAAGFGGDEDRTSRIPGARRSWRAVGSCEPHLAPWDRPGWGARCSHSAPLWGVRTLEDALVDAVHGELLARAMASGATLAQDRCVRQGVGSSRNVVVAALAGGGDRRRCLSEAARTGYQCLGPDVLHQISARQVAGGAIPQVAREPDVLVIGSPQHVGIGQVLAAVDAVDLPGEVHALIRGAIHEGGIVADHAFLGSSASAAVNEAQIHMAGCAFSRGYHLTPSCDRALVYREIELDGLGGIGGRSSDYRTREQSDRVTSFDGNGVRAHGGGGNLIGHGIDVHTTGTRRLAGVFGYADCARAGVVVGVGAAQNHPDLGDLADVDRVAGFIHHTERNRSRIPWRGVFNLNYLGNQGN